MAENVTLRKIFRDEKETKFGKGIKTTIYTLEYPDERMSTWSKQTGGWKEGDKVSVEITRNGQFVNFKPAAMGSELEARVKRLEDKVFGHEESASKETPKQEAGNDFGDF